MTDKPVRTRFAPSPTGYLHVGGIRTALFAWLVAKQAGGQFILRIEDTDRSRHVEESEQHIIDSLNWLGLKPHKGPVRQSERLEIYKEWAQKLVDSGRAYADVSSPEDLNRLRDSAKGAHKPFLFREHRPSETPPWEPGMPLRFKSEPKNYSWQDEVMGELHAGPESVDDFILIKSDSFPTYNFAHIIDDHLMGITHVIRSQEFLPSVPKFLNLYEALEIERPKLATLPYVLGPDGNKKLSKRDGAKDILDYKKEGYLPEALISFLATLGWNDGTEQEIYAIDELIKKFSLARVQRSGARFDDKRLEWVDGHFIREMPLDELYKLAEPFWPDQAKESDERFRKDVLGLVQERLKFLAELRDLTWFFFRDPTDEEILGQLAKAESVHLSTVIESLQQSDFSYDDIKDRLNDLLQSLNTKPAVLFSEIRGATTGAKISPELFSSLSVLGKDKVLARLQRASKLLGT
ncbi:MAG TPA: glutamate--tRNA ligase [Candidatus Saccharimonadales bacterium]|nr:glutamate--tRNA ligase [Candidatus Saccharimonadales bacterium]